MQTILAYIKKYYVALLVVVLLIFTTKCAMDASKSNIEAQESSQTLAKVKDTLNLFRDSLAQAQKPIIQVIHQIDTLWRIRTLVLAKVDSSWRVADSAIALVPASDSSCHVAYNSLKSGCELLKKQVVSDSMVIKNADSVLKVTNSRLLVYQSTINTLHSQLITVQKPYVCKILFISCPSRGMTAVLAVLGVEALRIVGGKP